MPTLQKFSLKLLFSLALVAPTLGNTARTCFTCDGINCLRTSLSTTQQCQDKLDYCVTIYNNFNVVRKGCSAEVPIELRQRCDANMAECHKCHTDRCNNLGHKNFKCLQCDSSKDTNCAKNAAPIAATRCASPTAPNSYCFVKYEGNATKRGCATTVAEQQKCFKDGNCLLCLPGDIQGCNNIDFQPGSRSMRF